ncbi:MAG: protocatechuate 3,4-dioxygenase subunit alpha [Roseococcus sp.]
MASNPRGEAILLRGRVLRADAVPCLNQTLEAWQADAAGRFDHPLDPERKLADPDFLGWGRAWTDAEGSYEFRTIIPGGYADAAGQRAPHLNLSVMGAGLMRFAQTIVFFPDFPVENAADPVLALMPEAHRGKLVAVPDGIADGVRVFRFDIRLQGDAGAETPFFED